MEEDLNEITEERNDLYRQLEETLVENQRVKEEEQVRHQEEVDGLKTELSASRKEVC